MKKLIIIALVMAIITGIAVFYYTSTLETKFAVPTTPVVVAAKMIPKNTVIAPEMLDVKQLPLDVANSLAAVSIKEIKGLIAKEDIEINEQVLTTKLTDPKKLDDELAFSVKVGYRAMTIKVDESTGIAGHINKGDFVDLSAVGLDLKGVVVAGLVAENLEVLAVGNSPNYIDDKEKAELYETVTFAAKAEDVVKITHALSEGKCRLVLRSVLDKGTMSPEMYLKYIYPEQ